MAKKKRNPSGRPGNGTPVSAASAPAASAAAATVPGGAGAAPASAPRNAVKAAAASLRQAVALPLEVTRGDWTVVLLSLMIFFAPALGVPHEEMLQDTLKSIVVSFATVTAALLLFWGQRNRRDALRWHFIMWLPLALMAYALGSMVWSHTYLGGVEAIRWFIFSLILWLGLNTLSRERLPYLAWGIHWGAVVASLWTVLQFLVDFKYFPQGPNPASTFVNRNFFAEFAVCTLPFTVILLARARMTAQIFLLAATLGFNMVAIMMTGTRSALVGMLILAFVMPAILVIFRSQFAFRQWDSGKRIIAMGVLLATVLGLGMIPTQNPKMIEEHKVEQRGMTGLQRGFARVLSIARKEEYTVNSFSVRLVMWRATARIIEKRPLTGVGAGAWEVDLPLYQQEGAQLETDYYVHNEFLQLMAEYGLVGWLFLLLLFAYLLRAAWQTWRLRGSDAEAEGPWRAVALASLLAFMVVSNAGFAWRMASTGTLFALTLALLAASDARLGLRGWSQAGRLPWKPVYSQVMAVVMMLCLVLTTYISQQAAECEAKIVRAVKLALSISQSGDPNNPRWDKTKAEMLKLISEGVAINPHYRKITPMVADELAKWGDWKNAIWIWESVVSSRPYVVAIMSNIARGYVQLGDNAKALENLYRAKKLQPNAPAVRSLEVILLSRTGNEAEGLRLAREYLKDDFYDFDLLNAAYVLAVRAKDWPMAVRAMQLRIKSFPAQNVDSWLKIGDIYAASDIKDESKALEAYKAALAAAPEPERLEMRTKRIPTIYQARL
jgi:O-antigen ligase